MNNVCVQSDVGQEERLSCVSGSLKAQEKSGPFFELLCFGFDSIQHQQKHSQKHCADQSTEQIATTLALAHLLKKHSEFIEREFKQRDSEGGLRLEKVLKCLNRKQAQ